MNRFCTELIRPGVHLMRRMSITAKMRLMAAIVFVPVAALLWFLVNDVGAEIRVERQQAEGVRVESALFKLMSRLQAHRALTYRAQAGDPEALGRAFRRWSVVGWVATALLYYGLWVMAGRGGA